ncbi:MAG TPA: hypothetical protein VN774_02325 [Candidatus Limnocylindrales bacterium]|nr:hypothetical protein [Candidatus Limnocylindrales bacterium]
MKLARNRILGTAGLIALACTLAPLRAQDKQSSPAEQKKITPLKITIVVTELDGAKKISSLPYTFFVNSDDSSNSRVRVGLRVPVAVGSSGNGTSGAVVNTQYQYQDIGTNIDCAAYSSGENRFKLALSVERSFLSSADGNKALTGENVTVSSGGPIIQHFSSSYNLLIHDGQTIEATSTTDPVSGRVLQISVTANVVK